MGKRRAEPFAAPPFNREGNRKARRKAAADRLVALEMLLDATWTGTHFHRREARMAGGLPTHWNAYFDRNGKPITAMQAAVLEKGVTSLGNLRPRPR